ncbi:hypothetical protein Q4368_10990 [Acinetobacter baumannii]
MLFTEEEISKLNYFPEFARNANIIYGNNRDIRNINNKAGTPFDVNALFINIKDFIINFDKNMSNKFIITDEVEEGIRRLNYRVSNYDFLNRGGRDVIHKFFDIFFLFLSSSATIRVSEYLSLYEYILQIDSGFEAFYSIFKSIAHDEYDASLQIENNKKFILHDNKISEIEEQVLNLRTTLIDEANKILEPRRIQFVEDTNKIISDFQKELSQIHAQFVFSIKDDADKLEKSIKSTDADFKATYEDYDILKKMVQAKGEQEITHHYKRKAFIEMIVYWVATFATIAIIYFSIDMAKDGLDEYKKSSNIPITALIENYKDQPAEKVEKIYSIYQNNALVFLILRLVISILIFLTIIFTSRIAYRAYIHMRHSENMRLKLATLRPFINHLTDEDKKQIHKDLIPDYFGKDAGLVDKQEEKFKDIPSNVSAVAMKAIEQISGSGNNSSTQRNGKNSDGGTE